MNLNSQAEPQATVEPPKQLVAATVIPVFMMLAAIILKPPWRDEFWSLYYTDPSQTLRPFSIAGLHHDIAHPPLYHFILHFWRWISPTEFWARGLSVVFLAAGIFVVIKLWRDRPELKWFLLICAGSYWVIYFATETRPYALVFALSAISVFVAARALQDTKNTLVWAGAWWILGTLLALSHYFAAVWMSSLGLCVGLAFLSRGSLLGFLAWGTATVAALLPTGLWLMESLQLSPPIEDLAATPVSALVEGLNQFLRGLVVKLMLSNVALTAAAIFGAYALIHRRETIDRSIAGAAIITITLAFLLQVAWIPFIKERGFIVIMPALIFLGARAITHMETSSVWFSRCLKAAPVIAAVTPFLFIPEYFKDREQLGEVTAFLKEHGTNCSRAPIIAHHRGQNEEAKLSRWVTGRIVLAMTPNNVEPPSLIDARTITSHSKPLQKLDCKIKAVALLLPRGAHPEHDAARSALRKAGVPLDSLVEHRFGKMRQLVFTER